MPNFDAFANFTVANCDFLNPLHKCKLQLTPQNSLFYFLTTRLKTQTKPCSQQRMGCWRITIFNFLDAQLDFLAIFSTPP